VKGGGDPAWAGRALARDQFAGRSLGLIAEGARIRPDGTVEVVRPHRPGARPRRKPELRFSRA